MATRRGMIKKTSLADYAKIKANGLIAINLVDNDELRWVDLSNGSNDILIATRNGQAARFAEREVRPMGRDTRGVTGIRLKGDDEVVGMQVIHDTTQQLLVVTEQGFGKRTDVERLPDQAPRHRRGHRELAERGHGRRSPPCGWLARKTRR